MEKKNKDQNNLDISRAYSKFSWAIFVVVIVWVLINSVWIYYDQLEKLEAEIATQARIIEKIINRNFSRINNFSVYVGSRIAHDDSYLNKNLIASLLKRDNSFKDSHDNIYPWLDMGYIGPSGKIEITANEGVLFKKRIVFDQYPIEEALEDRWKLKIGRVIASNSRPASQNIVPTAMAIDSDNGQLVGLLVAEIPSKIIQKDLDQDYESSLISYVVINSSRDVLASSGIEPSLFSNGKISNLNEELTSLFLVSDFDESYGHLKNSVKIGNINYSFYQHTKYPVNILLGYSAFTLFKVAGSKMLYSLFQALGILILFWVILYLFKQSQIIPIIEQLLDSKEKAELASVAKNQFLSTISHELRTPMNGIIGMSQILKDSKEISEEQKEKIETINRCADSLMVILNDILDFAKIEAGKIILEKDDFDLHFLIEDIADIMMSPASKKGIEIVTYVDKKIPKNLVGDLVRIRQILTNLINNAVKFTNHGQVAITASLKERRAKNYEILFNIEDSGIGIEDKKIDQLFDKFYQGDMSTSRRFGGTGLGLSICRELVKLMDGQIGVKSDFGRGSNFWFTLILHESDNKAENYNQNKIQQLNQKSLLIIGENKIAGNLLKLRLEDIFSLRVDYIDVKNYEEVLNKKYDLIILDFPNEKEDINPILEIKKNPKLDNIPVILLISPYRRSAIENSKLEEFNNILSKPVRNAKIIQVVLDAFDLDYYDSKGVLVRSKQLSKNKISVKEKTGPRILLCEDNEVNMRVAVAILERMGYVVDVAENGLEGVNKFYNIKYDLIFMDCMMPILDGFEATIKIRESEKQNNISKPIPIIAVTANYSKEDERKCLDSGMNDFIAKPIRRDLIENVIKKWIG